MKPFIVAFLIVVLAGVLKLPACAATNLNNEKQKSVSTTNGSIPWDLTVLNTGPVSMRDPVPIGCIWVKASIAPTFKAKSVSSIHFQTILQDTRRNSCLLISLMRPRTNL